MRRRRGTARGTRPSALPLRRRGVASADDLDGAVPLLLQLLRPVGSEERLLIDHRPLLLRVEIVRIAQQQGQGAELLREREDLRFLRQRQERDRREALLFLWNVGGRRGEMAGGKD